MAQRLSALRILVRAVDRTRTVGRGGQHGAATVRAVLGQTCFQRIHVAELKKLATTDPGVTSSSAATSSSAGRASSAAGSADATWATVFGPMIADVMPGWAMTQAYAAWAGSRPCWRASAANALPTRMPASVTR